MVAPTLKNKQSGRGWRPRHPVLTHDNFLSEQGLGGPWELATAKASGALASTVYSHANNIIGLFVVRKFLRGCGGTFFKKFPRTRVSLILPQIPLICNPLAQFSRHVHTL